MRVIESSVVISATPTQTWLVYSEVVQWPEWMPTVTRVDALDSRELKLGARYRISQPKLHTTIWSITELTPPYSFSWKSRSSGICVEGRHTIDEISPAETRATSRIVLSGPLNWLAAMFLGRLTQDYLSREPAALKRTVEGVKSLLG